MPVIFGQLLFLTGHRQKQNKKKRKQKENKKQKNKTKKQKKKQKNKKKKKHFWPFYTILAHFVPFWMGILSKMTGNFIILAKAPLEPPLNTPPLVTPVVECCPQTTRPSKVFPVLYCCLGIWYVQSDALFENFICNGWSVKFLFYMLWGPVYCPNLAFVEEWLKFNS